jgi:hypothetical protein
VLGVSFIDGPLTRAGHAGRLQSAAVVQAPSDLSPSPGAGNRPVPAGVPPLLAQRVKQRIVVADFDRDGRDDVAIGDFSGDVVVLFQGMPDGRLRRWGSLASGRGPRALVGADLDADGAVDLAVLNFLSGTVAIFSGGGDGRFRALRSLDLAPGVSSMIGEDFDRDGRLDLAVANALTKKLTILKNLGRGVFQRQDVEGLLPDLAVLTSADIDGDRKPDVVATDPAGATGRWFGDGAAGARLDTGMLDAARLRVGSDAAADSPSRRDRRTLQPVAGDGDAIPVSPVAASTFSVQLSWDGAPLANVDVHFLQLLEGAAGAASTARPTDESGRAMLEFRPGNAAGVRAVAASSGSSDVAVLGALAVLPPASLVDRIELASRLAPLNDAARVARQEAIARASASLRAGRTAAAVEALTAGAAVDVMDRSVRVLVDQLLLLGAASEADTPTVTVLASDATADEVGVTGPDVGTFTISRTGSIDAPLYVLLTTSGTAAVGADYTNVGWTNVWIPAGQASVTKTVTPLVDGLVEPTETVTVTLAPGSYAIGTPATATVTIAERSPTVTIVATDAAADELGLTGPDVGTFTIRRSGPTHSPLYVLLTTSGTATVGADYTNVGWTNVWIPAGQASVTKTVTPLIDALVEPTETVTVTLAPRTYVIGAPATATVTITERSPTVTIVATDAAADELGLTGPDVGTFTIRRSGPTHSPLYVLLTTSGTATVGADYTNIGWTNVWIPAGQASVTKTVTPVIDALVEPTETVTVTLAPRDYVIGAPSAASVTITERSPTVTIVAVDPTAREVGMDVGIFRIARTGPTHSALYVLLATGGTATAGADYTNVGWTNVWIPAGQASVTKTVTPVGDGIVEPAETVTVTLAPRDYVIGTPAAATVTIAGDSPAPPPLPPLAPRLVLEAPTETTVGLNATYRWRLENPEPGVSYQFELRFDKGTNVCDSGIEEAFTTGTATCLAISLDARRYSNQTAEFGVRAIDSQGRSVCQSGGRLFFDPRLAPHLPCP